METRTTRPTGPTSGVRERKTGGKAVLNQGDDANQRDGGGPCSPADRRTCITWESGVNRAKSAGRGGQVEIATEACGQAI